MQSGIIVAGLLETRTLARCGTGILIGAGKSQSGARIRSGSE